MTKPSDVDALFKLPLGEFTAARNALSAEIKKAGRQEEADFVRALAKPSVSAWAVNQLYWQQRKLFDRLLEAVERLRRAQTTGVSTRESTNERRDAVAELGRIAEGLLRDGNYGATRDTLRRVTTTLDALASFHGLPNAPVPGRLVDDVDPPGFDAVAGLVAPALKRSPFRAERPVAADKHDHGEGKRALAAAKTAVREAERALKRAKKQAERAAAERDAAAARVKAIEAERAQLELKLDRTAEGAAEAGECARQATAGASKAAAEADNAERALELARQRVHDLLSRKGS